MNALAPIVITPGAELLPIRLNPVVGTPRTGGRRAWTNHEVRALRDAYPAGGTHACLPLLPGRSATAILNKARAEKLSRVGRGGGPRRPPQAYKTTEGIDAALRAAYRGTPSRGAIKRLCIATGRPADWLSRRATTLGLTVPRFKEPDWTPEEEAVLRELGGAEPIRVAAALRARGYRRTPAAVAQRLKRLRIRREEEDGVYTVAGLVEVLGCSRGLLVRAIEKGWLRARRKSAGHRSPGGEAKDRAWLIRATDVRIFVMENVSLIDFRRVDKFWLVDLLAGARAAGTRGRG